MKSIIQKDRSRCYLCGKNGSQEHLDEHHVYAGLGYRDLSEKYGLKVYLHSFTCHNGGPYSVHKDAEVGYRLKADVQKKAMEYYHWTVDDFVAIFGKNYL